MRNLAILLTATSLAACGGGGDAQSVSSGIAPPAASGSATPSSTGSGTTTGNGGTGSGVSGTTGTGTTASGGTGAGVAASSTATNVLPSGFLTLTSAKTFQAVGSLQSLTTSATTGELYQGNASTVRAPSGTVAYDPRDGIFTLTLNDIKAGTVSTTRFQDPGHRTNPTGYASTPVLNTFNYIQAIGSAPTDTFTMFYQRPGSATTYVSLAGFARDNIPVGATATRTFERGAFVFGDLTPVSNIPATGTASYSGGFLASMVANPELAGRPTYTQWLYGNSTVSVDFGRSTAALTFSGIVDRAYRDGAEVLNVVIPALSTFNAAGNATIDLVRSAGFIGAFSSATFTVGGTVVPIQFGSVSATSSVAGASSIDGAFYGPGAANVGGNFRITGGVPDQRVDLTGAFVGTKP